MKPETIQNVDLKALYEQIDNAYTCQSELKSRERILLNLHRHEVIRLLWLLSDELDKED